MEQIQSNLPGYRNNRSTFPDGVYRSQSMPGETCGRKCILERMLERRRKEKEGVLAPKSEGSAAAIRRARRSHGIIIRRICMHDFEVAFTRLRPTQPALLHGQTSRIIDEDIPYARKPGSRSRPGEEVSIPFQFPSNLYLQGIYARAGRYDRR